ncbi:MAG: ATP-binding protein [Holosporaceae bacterium]|jgi:predicted AAA+ superfamily ATPase|nr:ATP-binding protein [Holosporaceae bacterium]
MVERFEYLEKLKQWMNKKIIKVITGIRRCGKSTLFEIFQNYLLNNGVETAQIQHINFENADFEDLTEYKALHSHIKKYLLPNKMNYIFLDEVQNVTEFPRVVDSLYLLKNVDLYITGSNAHMLSGEIATLLSGRYVQLQMLPLSFKEYLSSFVDKTDISRKYRDYLVNSSFPYTLELEGNKELIRDYLSGIYNTVILKDVVARKNISDIALLERVIRFMFDNIGSLTSIKKISDTITSDGCKISNHTVENYISALVDSFILYKVGRFDVKGKQYLKSGDKYYLADVGLRYFLLGSKKADIGRMLENVVYLELIRKGYEVYVGKIAAGEVDFVAVKNGNTEYYQVSQTVRPAETLERELASLDAISDHNPKYLITLDDDPEMSHNGIKQINAIDWLLW